MLIIMMAKQNITMIGIRKMNFKKLNEQLEKFLEFTNALEEPIWELEEYLGNELDNYGFNWSRKNGIVYFAKNNKQVEYDANAYPVPVITAKIDGKIVEQRQILNRFDIDKILDYVIE